MPRETTIAPSRACKRLAHPLREGELPTGDRVTYCLLCTMAYRQALEYLEGDTDEADAFVTLLRRGHEPVT